MLAGPKQTNKQHTETNPLRPKISFPYIFTNCKCLVPTDWYSEKKEKKRNKKFPRAMTLKYDRAAPADDAIAASFPFFLRSSNPHHHQLSPFFPPSYPAISLPCCFLVFCTQPLIPLGSRCSARIPTLLLSFVWRGT